MVHAMMISNMLSLLIVAGLASVAMAQSKWAEGQVSATMCMWEQPRGKSLLPSLIVCPKLTVTAAVLRDTLYVDGGYIFWTPGFADGHFGEATQDGKSIVW